NKIFLTCAPRLHRCSKGHALYTGILFSQQRVGTILDPLGHVGIGWTAIGWVILEATVLRRVVRRRDDDAVGQMFFAATVVDENSVRDNRRRSYPVVLLNDGFDFVGGQHLQRGALRRPRHRVGVLADVERSVSALAAPVIANRLGDGEN